MNPKLRNLLILVGGGVLAIGTATYLIATPKQTTTRFELADAGITTDCSAVVVECQVRNRCQQLPDGGMQPRYGTLQTKAMKCPLPGRAEADFALVLRWPRQGGQDCFEVVGPPETACAITDPQCTDATLCAEDPSGEQPVRQTQSRCACAQPDAGTCTVAAPGGGTRAAPIGMTLRAPFNGPGCIRKSCEEAADEVGASWPAQCPMP
jgi:hypothetical protein